jgi:TonB family protein
MKVCPQCQASFEEGQVYCPHDDTQLQQYDLRGALRRRQQQELKLLLPGLSFPQRLQSELLFAAKELRRHPLLFLKELLRGEGSPRRRIYLLQAGAALAVMGYALVVTALLLWGVSYGIPTERVAAAPRPPIIEDVIPLVTPVLPHAKSDVMRTSLGHLGGSLPERQKAQGGGSGGKRELLPASGGVVPQIANQPQIVLPNPHPPSIPNAALVVPMHVIADVKSLRPTAGQIGLANALPSPPSSGLGTGGGMGNQHGTGVGDKGDGAGYGNGYDWNTGSNRARIGGGDIKGSDESIPMASGSMRPTITYREKARYTEAARHDHVQGVVVLLATFLADGRITNIRMLKGLPQGLTEEAVKAAQRIRFTPALKNGVPVTVQARLEYTFNLY